jgi:hypothetical protein
VSIGASNCRLRASLGVDRLQTWKLINSLDYEQQRKDLLHKYGIDLADGKTKKSKKMDRKALDEIMGEDPEGIFTWREKNRKKARRSFFFHFRSSLLTLR